MGAAETTRGEFRSQSRAGRWTLAIAGLILISGVALALLSTREPPPPKFTGKVADLLPSDEAMAGWTKTVVPIADAPETRAKVEELLSYDDAVFCHYTRPGERISIYIAHWNPGKMPYRAVAGHTPDVCWVMGGWQIAHATSGDTIVAEHRLLPAEYRAMTQGPVTEHVVFWHLLDGRPKTYRTQWKPPWYAALTDMYDDRLNQRPEQWFIRVSSNQGGLLEHHTLYARLSDILISGK